MYRWPAYCLLLQESDEGGNKGVVDAPTGSGVNSEAVKLQGGEDAEECSGDVVDWVWGAAGSKDFGGCERLHKVANDTQEPVELEE
jgi:hypothetical protein